MRTPAAEEQLTHLPACDDVLKSHQGNFVALRARGLVWHELGVYAYRKERIPFLDVLPDAGWMSCA
jgi:hypothetical protein